MAYNNKKRPNTWDAVSSTKKTASISRVKRWKSQQKKRASRSSTMTNNRNTVTTISTLTFSNKNSIHWQHNYQQEYYDQHQRLHSIFHAQSLLFLFGFLFFPCWWIGGYYSNCIRSFNTDIETTTIVIHPSMIANGKTSSRLIQLPHKFSRVKEDSSFEEVLFFYKWNRYMSIFSIFLFLLVISMLIWYSTLF